VSGESISEEFAIRILRTCYELDAQLAAIEKVCFGGRDGNELEALRASFAEVTTTLGAQVMIPIYEAHPSLGRVMEPGDWLANVTEKFGFRASTT
jgi:hypothetical protein